MKFFDANMIYGHPAHKQAYKAVVDVKSLQRKMSGFGIAKALVHREEQFYLHANDGNMLLAEDIAKTDNLWGIWTILPVHCHEMPGPDEILALMEKSRIAAWQAFPEHSKFTFHRRIMKHWLELAERNHIPLFLDVSDKDRKADSVLLFDIMDKYPDLTVILRNTGIWPPDRTLRPLLSEFTNAYMELCYYLVPGGLEQLVADGYGEKIVFSSRFHSLHAGGPMMMLKHADIPEEAKELIASGNLEKILEAVSYD